MSKKGVFFIKDSFAFLLTARVFLSIVYVVFITTLKVVFITLLKIGVRR